MWGRPFSGSFKMKWRSKLKVSTSWSVFLLMALLVNRAQGQYRQQDQFGQHGSPIDGRTYYYATGDIPPGSQFGQNYDNFGRPTPYDPSLQFNPYAAPQSPQFPVRSQGSCYPPSNAPQTITVRTKLGELIGKSEYMCDHPDTLFQERRPSNQQPIYGNVSVFLGIPYAVAPIGNLRFRPPIPHRGWHRLEAISYRPACPQPSGLKDNTGHPVPLDEDCLYLNIFAPSVPPRGEAYPVMIYIHGGEFESGTSAYFPGHMLAASMNVIVVTFNYRLGALGFFSTGDQESPGNYGMLDQSLAIRWVYENINSFYGNSMKITLFGPDAGAASAGLHMLSPRTRDLFQHVIAQDGAAVADWAIITNMERARNTSRVFADRVGCDSSSFKRLVACLRNRSPRELTDFRFKPQLGMFPWAPVVDRNISMPEQHRFMPDLPEEIIRKGQFDKNKLYVTGVTRDGGSYILLRDLPLSVFDYRVNVMYFKQKVRDYIKMYNYTLNAEGALNAILFFYTNWVDPLNETLIRDSYVNMLSDSIYKAPVDKMVKLLSEQGVRTYMYVFNTSVESLRQPLWKAVAHNTEWYFLTGAPFLADKYLPLLDPTMLTRTWTDDDRRMSELMMRMWSNIARYRNPTEEKVYYLVWNPVQRYQINYLSINTTRSSQMFSNYRQTECAFWNVYMPSLWGRPPPDYPIYYMPWWQYEQPLQIGFWSAVMVAFLLFVMLIVFCCLYCRVAGHNKARSIDFNGSLPPEDYSLTHPIESETTKNNNKFDTQHTLV